MYAVATKTSWQKSTTRINLHEIQEAMPHFPLIERKFFDDLIELCRSKNHYSVEAALQHVVNPAKQSLDPDFWIFLWAVDFKDREFQILFERHPAHGGKGAIAAVGPTELLEFLSSMKQNGILALMSLINEPEKMKKVSVLVSQPKSYSEQRKEQNFIKGIQKFEKWIDELKRSPNKRGQWFPTNKPLCPVCGEPLLEFPGYEIGFRTLVCPRCGAVKPVIEGMDD